MEYDYPCKDPFSFSASVQSNTQQTNSYDATSSWTLTPFNVSPYLCEIKYRCVNVYRTDGAGHGMGCDDFNFETLEYLVPSNRVFSITVDSASYFNGQYPPGEYKIRIRGTTVAATVPRSDDVEFTLILTDICDPPSSVFAADDINDVTYTPTTTQQQFGIGSFSAIPAQCPYRIDVSYTRLTNTGVYSDTAITYDNFN